MHLFLCDTFSFFKQSEREKTDEQERFDFPMLLKTIFLKKNLLVLWNWQLLVAARKKKSNKSMSVAQFIF